MIDQTVLSLRAIIEKHYDRLVEIGWFLSRLPHPTNTGKSSYFGLTPWDILPKFSGRLLQSLKWYEDDRNGGFFPKAFYSPGNPYGNVDGLFEARFFAVFHDIRALASLLPMIQSLYKPESGWFPNDHASFGLGYYDSNEKRDVRPEAMASNYSKIDTVKLELESICQDFNQTLDGNWSGGWN